MFADQIFIFFSALDMAMCDGMFRRIKTSAIGIFRRVYSTVRICNWYAPESLYPFFLLLKINDKALL